MMMAARIMRGQGRLLVPTFVCVEVAVVLAGVVVVLVFVVVGVLDVVPDDVV